MMSKEYTLKEAASKFREIERLAENLINETDIGESIIFDSDDPDQYFLRNQYIHILSMLRDAVNLNKYTQLPIAYRGVLEKNRNGRYELSGIELSSGTTCEIFFKGDWFYTSIEHSGDYYATVLGKNTSIDGLRARIRRNY